MALNQKLTRLITGRSVVGADTDAAQCVVHFDDGSKMTVKVAAPPVSADSQGKVTRVRQAGTALNVDLDGGASISFTTPEPMASVMVRAANGSLEYAD
jgi:hypothetical protein